MYTEKKSEVEKICKEEKTDGSYVEKYLLKFAILQISTKRQAHSRLLVLV